MDATLKKRWVEALRSGEYEQGEGALRVAGPAVGTTYCCLGVLLDTFNPEGWRPTSNFSIFKRYAHTDNVDDWFGGLERVCSLAKGLFEGLDEPIQSQLINMNDGGKSFAEIADWIENNL